MRPKCCFLLLLLLLLPALSFAEMPDTVNPAAEFLVDVATKHYQRGEIDHAAHEFSKALMIDPNNKKALKYLNSMGITEGLYSRPRSNFDDVRELSAELRNTQKSLEINDLERQQLENNLSQAHQRNDDYLAMNGNLTRALKDKDAELADLNQRLTALQSERDEDRYAQMEQIHEIEALYADQNQDLEERIRQQKKTLADQYLTMSEKMADAESLEGRQAASTEDLLDYETKIENLSQRYNRLRDQLFRQRSQNDHLFDVVEDYVYVHSHAVGELHNELLAKNVNALETEVVLLARLGELENVYQSMDLYLNELAESGNLIDQQTENIHNLKNQLRTAQEEIERLKQNLGP